MLRACARRAFPRATRPRARACSRRRAATAKRRRVALLTGCAQAVLAPQINAATIRVLNRAGDRRGAAEGRRLLRLARCITWAAKSRRSPPPRANIDAWTREIDGEGLDAIVVTASGCGATIKDYGAMLADDPAYAGKAARVAALAQDPSEYLARSRSAFAAPRGTARRLSLRLLAAARPEDRRRAEGGC